MCCGLNLTRCLSLPALIRKLACESFCRWRNNQGCIDFPHRLRTSSSSPHHSKINSSVFTPQAFLSLRAPCQWFLYNDLPTFLPRYLSFYLFTFTFQLQFILDIILYQFQVHSIVVR